MNWTACCSLLLLMTALGCRTTQPETPPAPALPTFDVRAHGAAGDGKTLDTVAFRQAIVAVQQVGGGTVLVPRGVYLVEPIDMVSNMTLHLDEGAILLFSDDPDHYPLVDTRWEGILRQGRRPLLWAKGCENVSITGKGIIDGQGHRWWLAIQERRRQRDAARRAGTTLPANVPAPDDPTTRRPPLVQFRDCNNVLIDGVTMQNSPFWTCHILLSDNITVRNARFLAPEDGPNTDAIDIDSCRNVLVENCYADVGDDAFTLKSGRNEDGRRVGRPTENVTIRNCTVAHAHGGVVIGSEMSGDVRNIRFHDCTFNGTDAGVRIKTMRGRGGVVEDIVARNIRMNNVGNTFIITMRYQNVPQEPVSERTPTVRNVLIENITAQNSRSAGIILGLEERDVENLTLRNLDITAREGMVCSYGSNVHFDGVKLLLDTLPGIKTNRVTDLRIDGWRESQRPAAATTEAATLPATQPQ